MRRSNSIFAILALLALVAVAVRHSGRSDALDQQAANLSSEAIVVVSSGLGFERYTILRPELNSSLTEIHGEWTSVRRGVVSRTDWQALLSSLPPNLAEKKSILSIDASTGLRMAYEESPRVVLLQSDGRSLGFSVHPHHVHQESPITEFFDRVSDIEMAMSPVPETESGVLFSPVEKSADTRPLDALPDHLNLGVNGKLVPYLWYSLPASPGLSNNRETFYSTSQGMMRAQSLQVKTPPWLQNAKRDF